MKWETAGKVTGVAYATTDMTEYASTLTFPDPMKRNYISYMSVVIPGKLTLGADVRLIITDEIEEAP